MDRRFTFIEHLEELRKRLICAIAFVVIASIFTYAFTDKILIFFSRPVGRLVFIAPAEAFTTSIKIAIFGGLYISSPFILYEIWRFISSGLEDVERKYVLLFGIFSFVLFLLGSLLGYFIIVPIGLKFLMAFGTEYLKPMISVGKYVSFVMSLSFAFGVVFQLPMAILFLTKIGVVTPRFLSSNRKYAIVIIFIAAAIFTPPDIITQCLMAIPLWVLYEVSIFLSRIASK
ncbi:MAG: twin-arginine translocase subunit TatC [Candidatus Omnitrophica bacterium]|nr:twin-arginine translocase subunit TatC [Candidatus Omnitrophota bacterium]MBU1932409.1 twin-arginine translocase subunit TatC [Candidatus Omnitrophota bacterium]